MLDECDRGSYLRPELILSVLPGRQSSRNSSTYSTSKVKLFLPTFLFLPEVPDECFVEDVGLLVGVL